MKDPLRPTPRDLMLSELQASCEHAVEAGAGTELLAALGELRRMTPDDEIAAALERVREAVNRAPLEQLLQRARTEVNPTGWREAARRLVVGADEITPAERDLEALRLFRLLDRWQLALLELSTRASNHPDEEAVARLAHAVDGLLLVVGEDQRPYLGIAGFVRAHLAAFREDIVTACPELMVSLDLFELALPHEAVETEDDEEPATVTMPTPRLEDTSSLSLLAWHDPDRELLARLFLPGRDGEDATLRLECGDDEQSAPSEIRLYGLELGLENGRAACDPMRLRAAMDSWRGPPLSVREEGSWVAWPAAGLP